MSSSKPEEKKIGVITAATVLGRLKDFCQSDAKDYCAQFREYRQLIERDPCSIDLFFGELMFKRKRGDMVNEFLIDELRPEIQNLSRDIEEDKLWYMLDETDQCVDFTPSTPSDAVRHTSSMHERRITATTQNRGLVYARSGLRLYLDCLCEINRNILNEFGEIFQFPLVMYDDSTTLTKYQQINLLLIAHAWICEGLNYFGETPLEFCYQRMEHRIDLETKIMALLSQEKISFILIMASCF